MGDAMSPFFILQSLIRSSRIFVEARLADRRRHRAAPVVTIR